MWLINRELLRATLLYVISLAMLLFGFYLFLEENSFNRDNFLFGAMVLLLLSFFMGYLLNEYLLSKKMEIDKNLLHLTKEILHELNIPISTIQANTTLLRRTLNENNKALSRLSRIDASTVRLERLYRELIYSIKKEIYPVEKEQFNLEVLVQERIEAMKLLNRNPFLVKLDSTKIEVDKIGFEKMFDNILSNAMKYSDKNSSIEILLNNNILSIKDHGIGMDETELIGIYERYYQLDSYVSGEGIGLALVKTYCDDEKIKIRIDSKKGEGTKVSLDLSFIVC